MNTNNIKSQNLSGNFILIAFSVSIYPILTFPRLLSYGMFLDGQIYSSISRNFAEGFGTFWKPYYTGTTFPIFYEHPPFVLHLQSFGFKLFGEVYFIDHYTVVRL